MTCFPLMGVGDFVAYPDAPDAPDTPKAPAVEADGGKSLSPSSSTTSTWHVRGQVANSAYIPDIVINPHPRFGALTKNIRVRREEMQWNGNEVSMARIRWVFW